MWQIGGAEVALCCVAMCQLRFNSLLMWLCVVVPCGICWVRWPCMAVPCGIDWDEVDHWLTATWHCDGAHLSGDLCLGGAHLLTWTNRRVPRGTQLLRWLNQGLPCGTVIVAEFLNWCPFLSPSCTQKGLYPQIVPRVALIKSEPLINLFNLFNLLWIYFNSSTCPKILKFLTKISKFMTIIL
jgi:hypothetical protein